MEKTQRKKIAIIFIYLFLFLLGITLLYFQFRPQENCFDETKNQNELGIDCGGICETQCEIKAQDLIVEKIGIVPSGIAGKYDFYAQLSNPNAVFGSKEFRYAISLKNSVGDIVASKDGVGFILPGERKYVIENNIYSSAEVFSSDFKIISSDWTEFNEYYEKPDIQIINKNYNEISGGTVFSEMTGLLKNKSAFDFDTIKIYIILKSDKGDVLAINSTQMKTIKSGEERDFRVSWPSQFSGTVANMEVQAEVNVFDSASFLKRFYKTEKFQQY